MPTHVSLGHLAQENIPQTTRHESWVREQVEVAQHRASDPAATWRDHDALFDELERDLMGEGGGA